VNFCMAASIVPHDGGERQHQGRYLLGRFRPQNQSLARLVRVPDSRRSSSALQNCRNHPNGNSLAQLLAFLRRLNDAGLKYQLTTACEGAIMLQIVVSGERRVVPMLGYALRLDSRGETL